MSEQDPLYAVLYRLAESGGIKAEDIAEGWGGCDAALVAALTFPEGPGDVNVLFESLDGRTGEALPDGDVFKVWLILARHLGRSEGLSPAQRVFCETVWKTIFEVAMTQPREDTEG